MSNDDGSWITNLYNSVKNVIGEDGQMSEPQSWDGLEPPMLDTTYGLNRIFEPNSKCKIGSEMLCELLVYRTQWLAWKADESLLENFHQWLRDL